MLAGEGEVRMVVSCLCEVRKGCVLFVCCLLLCRRAAAADKKFRDCLNFLPASYPAIYRRPALAAYSGEKNLLPIFRVTYWLGLWGQFLGSRCSLLSCLLPALPVPIPLAARQCRGSSRQEGLVRCPAGGSSSIGRRPPSSLPPRRAPLCAPAPPAPPPAQRFLFPS